MGRKCGTREYPVSPTEGCTGLPSLLSDLFQPDLKVRVDRLVRIVHWGEGDVEAHQHSIGE